MNERNSTQHSSGLPVLGRLHGKVALVTGASSGIGEAAAKALAAQGASVVLAARRQRELDRVVEEITAAKGTAIAVRTDVTVDAEIAAAVRAAEQHFGGLDIAFNNAGALGTTGPLAEQQPEAWAADITTVLTSVFLSMRHEIPALQRRNGGVIVNNASQLGTVGFGGGISSYVAAKHGVVGLTKAAALEYARHDIRVNALALATVDTPMYRSSVGDSQEAADMFTALHPLGRIASAEEAASAVTYLAGDEASFFTGSVLLMDGGWTAQ
ncbi:SDR family oxidoreductase [Streptomyces zagrosensis]|uniref:NAD(P)-dependent dehydrogenase (Short-subunit alcohol dehydrogenase family) n=1 Tax=Streptomyces zagrosensis TaxID=1042984 RepID=A0A7W9QGQ8_9ACTN|nr:SDR family oxidoreductase [Streptomyces zagrosensis]MBB5938722.1 NAD(P)-dependent dehydrogenase (short-subunit alcohol dehydrogenase family) [Streptomyces zagrosensis]